MQLVDFFIIKDSGICAFSYNDKNPGSGNYCHDLVTPFFMAINSFANENYKEKIRWIELDDGTSIYFKHLSLPGGVNVTLAGVFPEHVNGKKNVIDRSAIELKWLLDKRVKEITSPASMPRHVDIEIREKIAQLFG